MSLSWFWPRGISLAEAVTEVLKSDCGGGGWKPKKSCPVGSKGDSGGGGCRGLVGAAILARKQPVTDVTDVIHVK
jgi:hypothetical protein